MDFILKILEGLLLSVLVLLALAGFISFVVELVFGLTPVWVLGG